MRLLEKRKDFISTAMTDYLTLLIIGRKMIGPEKVISFCTFLCNGVMLAVFWADVRWPWGNDRVKWQREDVQEQQIRFLGHNRWCHQVQQESQSEGLKWPSSPSQVQKTHNPGAVRFNREEWVLRVRSLGHKNWKETHNWGTQSSHELSLLWCILKWEKGW